MLQINNIQKQQLLNKQIEEFVEEVLLHLKDLFKHNVEEPDSEIKDKIRNWINDAKRYGITFRTELQRWIEFCFAFPELANNPKPDWLDYSLRVRGVSQKEIMDFIEYRLLYDESPTEEIIEENDFGTIV